MEGGVDKVEGRRCEERRGEKRKGWEEGREGEEVENGRERERE